MIIKRIALILLAILIAPTHLVSASAITYARVLKDGAYLYADQTFKTPVFEVPNSYYVKVESANGQAVRVSYNVTGDSPVIFGYMKSEDLTATDHIPTNPFAVIKVSLDVSDVLFADYNQKSPLFNVNQNEILVYYGKITVNDKKLCYVYYGAKLGYVDESSLNPFTVPPNSDPLPKPETPETPQNPTISQNKGLGEALQIIIIIGISVISISIVYFLFRPQKNETHEETGFLTDDET